jgi:hypothetical protein
VVKTKCCNCVKPGSIPGCLKIILIFGPQQVYALILCCFEPDVLSDFKALVAETRIWASLKVIFLESIHLLFLVMGGIN